MNISEVITTKYNDLQRLATKNVIKQVEYTSGLKDIEDLDLLHTLCIRWLKKYELYTFPTAEAGFHQLKIEFLGEKNNYQKMIKPDQKTFISITELNIEIVDE